MKSVFNKNNFQSIIVKNLTNLIVIQGANILIPILSVPYLIRILGSEKFGAIIYGQSLANYGLLLINFGFSLSAVKLLAENHNDKNKINEIFSCVVLAKLFLLFLTLFLFLLLLYFDFKVLGDTKILTLSLLVCISDIFFPTWFFQGLNKMKYVTYISIVSKFAYVFLVFLFIKKPGDYLLVSLFYFIGTVTSSIFSFYFIFTKLKIHFRFYSITKIIFYLKDSTNYFISNISIALFATSNRLFVGFSGNMNYVAYYDLAEKISSLLKIPQSMFTQSVFPVLSQKSNNSFIRNSFAYSIIFNFLLSIGCFFLSEKIIIISGGHAMIPSVAVLNVLLMTIPVIAISNVLGIQLLIPLGFNNVFKKILISVALFHVSTLAIISIISDYNLLEVAWLSLVSEIIISSLLFLFAMKRQLFKI